MRSQPRAGKVAVSTSLFVRLDVDTNVESKQPGFASAASHLLCVQMADYFHGDGGSHHDAAWRRISFFFLLVYGIHTHTHSALVLP